MWANCFSCFLMNTRGALTFLPVLMLKKSFIWLRNLQSRIAELLTGQKLRKINLNLLTNVTRVYFQFVSCC